jgi:hypothetical protein
MPGGEFQTGIIGDFPTGNDTIGLVVATLVIWMWHEARMGGVTRDGMTLAH